MYTCRMGSYVPICARTELVWAVAGLIVGRWCGTLRGSRSDTSRRGTIQDAFRTEASMSFALNPRRPMKCVSIARHPEKQQCCCC